MSLKPGKTPFETSEQFDESAAENQFEEVFNEIEPIESVPTEEEIKSWDKEKSAKAYVNLQRKISERDRLYREELEGRIRAEERAKLLEELVTKPKSAEVEPKQQLAKPVKPTRPIGYNKADAIAYPESESAKFDTALEEYYERKDAYEEFRESQINEQISAVTQTFEEQKNKELQTQEYARRKAEHISRLSKATGGDIKKATEVFDFMQRAMVKDDPSLYVKLYEMEMAKNGKQINTEKRELTSDRRINYHSPLSISNTNTNENDEQVTFMQEIKNRKGNKHSLFKTEPRN